MKAVPPPSPSFHPGRDPAIVDDPVYDPYQDRSKLFEPSVCSDCGAVYLEERWQWIAPPAHAMRIRCSACRRIHEEMPAGYVSIEGQFAHEHRKELIDFIRQLETYEKAQNPLERIMSIAEHDEKLAVTTTDIHLAHGIGEALHHAYQGVLDLNYTDAEYLLRVRWQR
ncbi:MAG TPA: BCAM0308 family protein [Burkholderiaceae bacterium]|jgi:hypothetical protein